MQHIENSDCFFYQDSFLVSFKIQIVLQKIKHGEFIRVDNFSNKTERGSGGFGSTGN